MKVKVECTERRVKLMIRVKCSESGEKVAYQFSSVVKGLSEFLCSLKVLLDLY